MKNRSCDTYTFLAGSSLSPALSQALFAARSFLWKYSDEIFFKICSVGENDVEGKRVSEACVK